MGLNKLHEVTVLVEHFQVYRSAEISFSIALAKIEARKKPQPLFPADELLGKLTKSRRSLSLFQHHDGITGTAKTHVMED